MTEMKENTIGQKVYIQVESTGIPVTKDVYCAMEGFYNLGYDIIKFNSYIDLDILGVTKNDIVVGGLKTSRYIFNKLGVNVKEIDFPDELLCYTKETQLMNIDNKEIRLPTYSTKGLFFKPYIGKSRDVKYVETQEDIDILRKEHKGERVWVSHKIENIDGEYRIFVIDGVIVDIRRYKGMYGAIYPYYICGMIEKYKNAPRAYTLDIAISDCVDNYEYYLIEVTDGYSLGGYGIESNLYAKFLATRWNEIMKNKYNIKPEK